MTDLVDGGINQVSAIEVGHDLNVIGLQARIKFRNLGMHAGKDLRRILVAQQQHGSLDDIVDIVLADNAVALLAITTNRDALARG